MSKMRIKLVVTLLVTIIKLSFSSASSCPWESPDIERWSDPSTWDDGVPPVDRQNIRITKKILLDTITPDLGKVDLIDGGMLIFDPFSQDVKLTADFIHILNDGHLIIGNPECEYPGNAEIELTGEKEGPDGSFGYLVKGIYVDVGGNLDFHGKEKLSWTQLAQTADKTEADQFDIKVIDEPTGWTPGDKLVIASTDYDMNQAEEVEVVECKPCSALRTSCSCRVKGPLKYQHYGNIYKGVDMRAEVGLLTRNIKIYGRIKDDGQDTYGGHIKAFEGFETYRIQGVELTRMGQKGIKGRYPIHWHMTRENDPSKTYAKDNSIHHVFQRCITVHGTHNVHVTNNVAYDTFGHCYFLEDGGEKNNTIHHNLGLVTRKSTTIPSDRMPATFWITSPLNEVTDNHAGGSEGMGIWLIFAPNVTGPSAYESFFQPMEAFRTVIRTPKNNVVHSNEDTGFMFGHYLDADQDFQGPGGTDKCDPRKDPLDPGSEEAFNLIQDLTAYKNPKQNTWNDCRRTTFVGYKSSDTFLGLTLKHNCDVIDATFIGESDNLGEPNEVQLRNHTKVMWHRSTPNHIGGMFVGLHLYDGNPYISGNFFADFRDDDYKVAGGIGFRKPHAGEVPTIFQNTTFDFVDGIEGNYVKGAERFAFGGIGDQERMGQVLDWDGTITGKARHTVVRDQPFYTSDLCQSKPHWGNMSVCPHRYVLGSGTGSSYVKIPMIITRDDIPEVPEVSPVYHDPWHPHFSTDHSYIYAFPNDSLPHHFYVILEGLDSGHSLVLGFCVPFGATPDQMGFSGYPKPVEVQTYDEMLYDTTGSTYHWDHQAGVVFRKFQVDLPRTAEDRVNCIPDGKHCPSFNIITKDESLGDTDCRSRVYPKYQKAPIMPKRS